MKHLQIYALVGLCSITLVTSAALAADPTSSATTSTQDQAKMPATSEFSNGPQGGGAQLVGTDHVPSAAEFSNGPVGGAISSDPTPRRLPSASERSNGPAGISSTDTVNK